MSAGVKKRKPHILENCRPPSLSPSIPRMGFSEPEALARHTTADARSSGEGATALLGSSAASETVLACFASCLSGNAVKQRFGALLAAELERV